MVIRARRSGTGRSLWRVDGFQAPVVAMISAGEASGAVADGVGSVDIAMSITTLAAAMPGGAVAQARTDVTAAWSQAVTGLADGMRLHSAALTDSAHAYHQTDGQAADALTPGR